MAFNPEDPKQLGRDFFALIKGFGDGVGADDMAAAMTTLSSGMAASNELQADTDAAIGFIVSGIAEAWAQSRIDVAAL